MQKRAKVIATLNDLIRLCRDSEELFRAASRSAESDDLSMLLQLYSDQRGKFAMKIQAEIYLLGGQPTDSGSFGGVLRRGWMNTKRVMSSGDDAIIAECIHCEEAAEKEYEEALSEDLPDSIRELIETQCAKIRETADRLATLESAAALIL